MSAFAGQIAGRIGQYDGPIQPVYDPAWLYVPMGRIVVPVPRTTPTTNYLLLESGDRILAQNGVDLFIQE